jgi:tetratricopeptide (TPR) repeat protein
MLQRQGDLNRARALQEEALAIYEASVGSDHPYTAIALANLGAVLHEQGELDAARTACERALIVRETRLGRSHDLTIQSRQALAAVIAELDHQK